jgi:hypothetical protein
LYGTVDFSFSPEDAAIPRREPKVVQSNRDAVIEKQNLWIRTLIEMRSYGSLVRSFTWTLHIHWEQRAGRGLFKMMEFLSEATRVCIDGSGNFMKRFDRHYVKIPLFPAATQVTLRGPMPVKLALAVLRGRNKPPLQSLSLMNLRFKEIEGYGYSNGYCDLSWPPDLITEELLGRCEGMDSLVLRKKGMHMGTERDDAHDEAIYRDWAKIIIKARPKYLIVGHGSCEHVTQCNPPGRWSNTTLVPPGPGTQTAIEIESLRRGIEVMDTRFEQHILPILLQRWPALKAVTVTGVNELVSGALRYLDADVSLLPSADSSG